MGSLSEILIVGTGALACLFAARLSAVGAQVGMLGSWREALEALRSKGVCLVDEGGKEDCFPVQVYDAEADRRPRTQTVLPRTKLALVLVKSWQTERAAQQLASSLEPEGLALTLQNGLGNREILSGVLGIDRTALGATTIGAALVEPGKVRFAGPGMIFLENREPASPPGLANGRFVSADGRSVSTAAALFEQAGFPVEWVSQADSLLWGKLVISAAINPLTAILNVPNGELLRRPSARELMVALALEAAAVAAASGIELPYADPVEVVEEVARSTSANYSSMLQDVHRRAPTEIDAICGALVAAAKAVQAPAPLNQALWLLVKALVQSSQPV